jgi:hypothetical protein
MFKVYHRNNPTFWDNEEKMVNIKDFTFVAEVDTDSYGDVFRLTNHIDTEWWNNEEVTLIKESRSTSVGDLVVDADGKAHLCCSVGWSDVYAIGLE